MRASLSTIEFAHKNITDKIGALRRVLEMVRAISSRYARFVGDNTQMSPSGLHVNLTLDDLDCMEMNYNLGTVGALTSYYDSVANEDVATKTYYRIITSDNYEAKLNACAERVHVMFKTLRGEIVAPADKVEHRELAEIDALLNTIDKIHVSSSLESCNYDECDCGHKMAIMAETSELQCECCGNIKVVLGTVFRDDRFYPQEGQRIKHSDYKPGRHYKFWTDHILGRKDVDLSEYMPRIQAILKRDGISRFNIDVERVRRVLKECKLTRLNNHTTLIMRLCNGPTPPIISHNESRVASMKFNKIMKLYEIVIVNDGNRPYYPYFIYKIFEHMFRGDPEKLRVLRFIHLQSRDTVVKNDSIMSRICAIADPNDDLVYVPTTAPNY